MAPDVQRASHMRYEMTMGADMRVMNEAQADKISPSHGSSEYGEDVGDDEENNSLSSGPT